MVANYYVPDAAGTHDFKIGYHWQIDSEAAGDNSESGAVRYLDARGRTNQILLTSVPVDPSSPDTRNRRNEFFIQDTWSPNNSVTLTLGIRYTHQQTYFLDNAVNPLILQEYPWIAGMEFEGQKFEVKTVSGAVPGFPVSHGKFAPRLGITYDLTGEGRSVSTGHERIPGNRGSLYHRNGEIMEAQQRTCARLGATLFFVGLVTGLWAGTALNGTVEIPVPRLALAAHLNGVLWRIDSGSGSVSCIIRFL